MTPSTDTTADVLFVGLPATGKTTYLALLYHAIATKKAGVLRLGSYNDDREYVNDIVTALASCTHADHTTVDQQEQLALSLIAGDRGMYLRIPDMSGESWEHAIEDRGWTLEIDRRVAAAVGFLVFVHSDKIDTQPTIAAVGTGLAKLTGSLTEANVNPTSGDSPTSGTASDFPPDLTRKRATQVSIVDLLQLLSTRHGRPMRVSLIVSAWDYARDGETPQGWLAFSLPLLAQFVETNESWLELTVWGISAQGGDFGDTEDRQQLLTQDVVERSVILNASGDRCSVEGPINWVLGLQG